MSNEYISAMMVKGTIDKFIDAAYAKHRGYAYSAGYLSLTLTEAISLLPPGKREMFMKKLEKSTKELLRN